MKPIIEPIILEKDKEKQLKKALGSVKISRDAKERIMRHTTGLCILCGNQPIKIVKYKRLEMIMIERYCDSCLSKFR